MKKAERERTRALVDSELVSEFGELDSDVADLCERLVVREIDRERRRAKKAGTFCHDCGGEVIDEPVLCEECTDRRDSEGMSREDKRKISTWRRT